MTRIPRSILLLASAALLQAPAPGRAQPPLSLPIKSWVLDYGDSACTASRAYGSAEAPATLAFRPSPTGTLVRLTLIRPEKTGAPVQFPLATNITDKAGSALRFASGDGTKAIVWMSLERSALDRLAAAGEIELRGHRFLDSRFALPAMAAMLKALDACNADLRRHWNVEGAGGARLSRPAVPLKPLYSYYSVTDYPDEAVKRDSGGTSVVIMMVDETGAPKDCLVEQSSGDASLDATACAALLRRSRFKPALDLDGKPVRSVLSSRVVWKISEEF